MAASNNEIYKLLTEFNGKLGELTGTLKALDAKVSDIREDMSAADAASAEYRAGVREELRHIVTRTTHLETDVLATKNRVTEMQSVTDDVKTMTVKAQGAGTAGRWAMRLGLGVVGFVGWAVGLYTWMTGRPPP